MQKKGQCPVSFLWRGQGIGLVMMKTSLVSFCVLVFTAMLFLLMGYRLKLLGFFCASAGCWLVGKLLSINGAQKRTRTSTK